MAGDVCFEVKLSIESGAQRFFVQQNILCAWCSVSAPEVCEVPTYWAACPSPIVLRCPCVCNSRFFALSYSKTHHTLSHVLSLRPSPETETYMALHRINRRGGIWGTEARAAYVIGGTCRTRGVCQRTSNSSSIHNGLSGRFSIQSDMRTGRRNGKLFRYPGSHHFPVGPDKVGSLEQIIALDADDVLSQS